MQSYLHIDVESQSACDVSHGPHVYWTHPSTKILTVRWCDTLDARVRLWYPGMDPIDWRPWLARNKGIVAFNAMFEACAWQYYAAPRFNWPSVPDDFWYCSFARASQWGCAGDLLKAGKAFRCSIIKSKEGKADMLKVSRPKRPTKKDPYHWYHRETHPEMFIKLDDYCGTDVLAEKALWEALPDPCPEERAVWLLDQRINRRGVAIDMVNVKKILRSIPEIKERYNEKLRWIVKWARPDMVINTTGQTEKIQEFCASFGVHMPNLQRDTVEDQLKQNNPLPVQAILQTRLNGSFASSWKFEHMLAKAHPADLRIRDTKIYYGSHTGRWSAKGLQTDNFKRTKFDESTILDIVRMLELRQYDALDEKYASALEAVALCMRGMVVAEKGKKLVVADYSNVEARVNAWNSDQQNALDIFKSGKCLYRYMASQIYKVPYDEVTGDQRGLGKMVILALGYGMGWRTLLERAEKDPNISMNEGQARSIVGLYRLTFPNIQKSWYQTNDAAINAVLQPGIAQANNKVKWIYRGGHLFCQFPSGRPMVYPYARVQEIHKFGRDQLALFYERQNPKTKAWEVHDTWGGSLVENVIQGISRDLLADWMLRIDREGIPIVLHVHDEAVCEVPLSIARRTLRVICELAKQIPPWAFGCPIEAAGYVSTRYKKD